MDQTKTANTLTTLTDAQLEQVINALPTGVATTLYAFPGLFIVGGFIRAVLAGEEIKDIDVFTDDVDVVDRAVEFYIRQCGDGELVMHERKTPCTITVTGEKYPVQFINNARYTVLQCINNVDFTICQAAIWRVGDEWHSLCTSDFSRDVTAKRLVYTEPDRVEAPGGSLWRATKFLSRGYTITQKELSRLVARCIYDQSKIIYEKQCPDVEPDHWSPDQIERSFTLRGPHFGGVY